MQKRIQEHKENSTISICYIYITLSIGSIVYEKVFDSFTFNSTFTVVMYVFQCNSSKQV